MARTTAAARTRPPTPPRGRRAATSAVCPAAALIGLLAGAAACASGSSWSSGSPAREAASVPDAADAGEPVHQPPPAAPARRTALLDGRRVHFLDAGRGEPSIVLVHGWASDGRAWAATLPALSARHRVLVVDLPGHGRSEPPERPYSMDLFADAVVAVLDEAGLRRAVLVGHSNGTPAVRQAWRRHPERVAALVLVDGPLRPMIDAAAARRHVAAFRGDGWRETVAGFVDSMPPRGLSPGQVASIRDMATAQAQEAVTGGLEAAIDPSIWGDDPVDAPALLLLAEQPAWTEEYLAHARGLLPRGEVRSWSGASHFLMIERPDDFTAALLGFVGSLG
jgi:pimeloyl-ACP methyl ester carboxylesterase